MQTSQWTEGAARHKNTPLDYYKPNNLFYLAIIGQESFYLYINGRASNASSVKLQKSFADPLETLERCLPDCTTKSKRRERGSGSRQRSTVLDILAGLIACLAWRRLRLYFNKLDLMTPRYVLPHSRR